MKKLISAFLSLLIVCYSCAAFGVSAADKYQNNDVAHVSIHDPSIVKGEDGSYYCVGSHLAMASSDDLVNWTSLGHSMEGFNYLTPEGGSWKDTLAEPLEWCMKYQRAEPDKYNDSNYEYNCWANNIIYNPTMGKYCLYGCCSVWGTTASAIWLCVSDSITGPYTYVKTLICSGITSSDMFKSTRPDDDENPVIKALDWRNSNVPELIENGILQNGPLMLSNIRYKWLTYDGYYNLWQYPNAIDPTAFTDKNGDMWLVYGSFSGGCYMHRLDKTTGLIDYAYVKSNLKSGTNDDIYYGFQISRTNGYTEGTGEGPFIVYDKVSGYYYFFLTYGGLAGDGGYNIREYRSETPTGPYTDAAGLCALDDNNTGLKLDGNYKFSCQPTAMLSGGHSSCLIDSDGSMYQAYHTRFTADGGWGHQMRVHKMLRTSDGWAVMQPFEYLGAENETAVTAADVTGEYEFIDSTNMTQRKATAESPWDDIILPTQKIYLNSDGTVTGARDYSCSITCTNTGSKAVSGSWKLKAGTAFCTLKLGGVTYQCVFSRQRDESAAAKTVMTFSGAGNDNSTVWGVMASRTMKPTVNAPKLSKLTAAKKSFTVFWKTAKGADGYQISYGLKKNFGGAKVKTVASGKTAKLTVRKLKAGKKYFVRVRSYRTLSGRKYFSKWSAVKSIKTK